MARKAKTVRLPSGLVVDCNAKEFRRFLRREYVIKCRSAEELGKELELSREMVHYWLGKHGLSASLRLASRGRYGTIKSMVGRTYGLWTVLSFAGTKDSQAIWLCRCKCGLEQKVLGATLRRHRSKSCKACWERMRLTGGGEISGSYWRVIQDRARKLDRDLTISVTDAWRVFLKQNRKCALSGVPLTFAKKYGRGERMTQTASLDRINSDLGYVPGNVQWVHKVVNAMKGALCDLEFRMWCNCVATSWDGDKPDYDSELLMSSWSGH